MALALGAIELPDDLIWINEFAWTPMQQTKSYTLSGALIIESGKMLAGRPITLSGGDDYGWASRATVKALYAALDADDSLTLTLNDARSFEVRFDHNGPPIQARQIIDYNNPDDGDVYALTLKLFTV
ncbi:hypothetical protein [Methylomonas sp. HYX-M1]|uniref:hypothetical protein n=1 Tax=Methylomonas sp. HYX-M1 TaxID=3139307 RepID=UPI00345C173C